ncbi:DeoR/GlpR transcriptional regulator [Duganella sp. BJB488]|uniref:DeoR/GlpR family DNA-binding transcription regulator n=1 Tax=unclassified Duganella TaxID=2636909 RepID=UPI000E350403|nr:MULTISPECIES: DeoR/GlpR family DNA-binding transcription regulator [unclassified Duganella]RFP25922.1 DeoR/GlpR transcriptional regulator [Duganella sp. BJB489]RFP28337.1 DeoR/GlpR transcriptional regulator [Duganella sp. BJB488]RFP36852.1 DeoR/GlpR transcriptional regulator [Duganella sp. BJB480]
MKRENLLLQERHDLILKQLQADGRVIASVLAQNLNVTEDTIRRDLRDLAAAGLCQKVYGGAVRIAAAPESGTLTQRLGREQSGKSRLATAAATLVKPGSVIFLDAGSSNLAIADALPNAPLTVLTNAPSIAARLLDKPQVELIMIGGRIKQGLGGSVGATALREVELLRPDLYFVGACGVDPEAGITAVDFEEAEFKRRLAAHSKATAVVATAGKLGAVASFLVLPIAQLTHLVVERDTDARLMDAYSAAGARLLRAE